MGKHLIETEALQSGGFTLIKIEDASEIYSNNTDRILNLRSDGTIDIIEDNGGLKLTTRVPEFKTLDF